MIGLNAMPAPTWHFLKANEASIEIPADLAAAPKVETYGLWLPGDDGAFEHALERAQRDWEEAHPDLTPEQKAELAAFTAAEADATYGGTAQSTYQIAADEMEAARSLQVAFKHGLGGEAAVFLRQAAGERIVVEGNPGESVSAQVVVRAVPGASSLAAIDVVAGRDSEVNLTIVVDGPDSETGGSAGKAEAQSGVAGSSLRVFADEDARVSIVRTQTLDDGFTDVDDMGLFAHERARIAVRQTVLGASKSLAGLAGDLRGDSACVDVDTHYLGHGDQELDFNYVLRHHGTRTRCNLNATGVLAGESRKTLRGTIDLIRGCKGSEGTEHETVLLVDEGVRNKTIPVILCNEDDVAGNHGATIGHIREEQMFYLASRGLPQEAAEAMFVGAMMEQALLEAPDEYARRGVARLGGRLISGFSSLTNEGGRDDQA